ncbi:hypothetical protein [Chryseobacterium sp.]|uniref:hypothetical protein n=1 Tax=Chryseobacterium sp. TaxID=1871047 RepID=UPI0024E23E94|nr:hypothetical protein [Chryseobacterium sp.]
MSIQVNRESIKFIKTTLGRLKMINDFETSFLISLLKRNYVTLNISKKQYEIYKSLKIRYDELDLFERYTDWFQIYGVMLDDYEKGYLETYKGEFEKTEAFKKFIKNAINKPKSKTTEL